MDIATDGQTLRLSGELDARTTWKVRAAIHDHLDAVEGDAVVDVTEVRAVDLTALRVLAFATRRAHAEGRRLTLRGCCPAVRRMLHLSRLYPRVEVENGLIA
ncbi:MAG: STAS domain-containing protein [Nocardioides sp.]|uniref:STAS domain-containing protein n=1 Tax=Nocardioides sp. TaxID=35761 RepID=UPI0039E5F89F